SPSAPQPTPASPPPWSAASDTASQPTVSQAAPAHTWSQQTLQAQSSLGPSYPGQSSLGPSYPGQSYPGQPAQSQPPAWRRAVVAGVGALAIALAAGGVGGFVGYSLADDGGSPLQTTSNSSGVAAPVIDRSSLASIAAAIQPTVVVISTGSGEGSGVVVSGDGYIVTNNHVVDGARGSAVQVTFNTGKKVEAKIVGTDPKTDLA